MLPFKLIPTPVPNLDEYVAAAVQELVAPCHRTVAMCVIENQDIVLVQRSIHAPAKTSYWDVVVGSGEFAGYLLDDCMHQEDAITLCDVLGMVYCVEI
jgi:hypothetical protein